MSEFQLESVSDRFAFLLRKIWGGSQTRMASDCGISQSSISNVITGRQQPGRAILTAVAAHPLVNAQWLLTGAGTPLGEFAGASALSVAKTLFMGLPSQNRERLADYLLPVEQHLFSPSRYWFEVVAGNPFVHDSDLSIAIGDKILFEPDSSGWPSDLRGHPCIARVGRGKNAKLLLAKSVTSLSALGSTDQFELYSTTSGPKRAISFPRGREQKVVTLDKHFAPAPAPAAKQTVTVVAVGIYRCGGFSTFKV